MAVLETEPGTANNDTVSVLETDLEVDFAPPVGYEEPKRVSGTSTPASGAARLPSGGMLHSTGTMAQAINHASIAPQSNTAAASAKAVSSNFLQRGGHKPKGSKVPTPQNPQVLLPVHLRIIYCLPQPDPGPIDLALSFITSFPFFSIFLTHKVRDHA